MIPELTLTGPPQDRGRQHGEELRARISDAIDAWYEHLAPSVDPMTFVGEVSERTGLRAAGEAHVPDLMAEVAGIAEGAGQDFETMFAWQLIDECWWYLDELQARDSDPAADGRERCSALAINHQGRGIVAQTQDLDRHCDGTQVMLRYLDQSGLEILAPSLAGLLAQRCQQRGSGGGHNDAEPAATQPVRSKFRTAGPSPAAMRDRGRGTGSARTRSRSQRQQLRDRLP